MLKAALLNHHSDVGWDVETRFGHPNKEQSKQQ